MNKKIELKYKKYTQAKQRYEEEIKELEFALLFEINRMGPVNFAKMVNERIPNITRCKNSGKINLNKIEQYCKTILGKK